MYARLSRILIGLALGLSVVRVPGSAAPTVVAAKPQPTIVPLFFLDRETSADHAFVRKAIDLAIANMMASQHEIAVAQTVIVQDEALRSFNTSAAAYNGLADIAAERRMTFAKPSTFVVDQTPSLAQDPSPSAEDFRYVSACQASLNDLADLYHSEAQHGKDPLVVAFAAKIRPRIVRDLELVADDIERLNHPALTP